MSVYLDYLADELAEIERTLAGPELSPYADGLRRAIAQARFLVREAGAVPELQSATGRNAFPRAA